MRAWPEPMAWVKTPKRPWKGTRKWADVALVEAFKRFQRPVDPPLPQDEYKFTPAAIQALMHEGLVAEDIEEQRIRAWKLSRQMWKEQIECVQPFIDQIPAGIRTIIAPLSHRAWHMLSLLARCPGAIDLYHSNPALAYALSGHWLYRERRVKDPLRSARALVYKRQRDILAWMGFPATKSTQRIFQKIEIAELHPMALQYMKAALADPERRQVLSHLPVIKPEVLALVLNPELFGRVAMSFLMELSEPDATSRALTRILYDTLRMDRMHGGGHLPACFHSIRRMHQAHDELTARGNRIAFSRNLDFPEPPYAGTADFEPIRTLKELVTEGEQMRHCVASYADRIAGGTYYVYRVLKPVRATLAIHWHANRWTAHELQGFGNSLLRSVDFDGIIHSFFEDTCLRGPVGKAVDDEAGSAADDFDDLSFDVDVAEPPPWVPCDASGHPLLLFSPALRTTAETIRAVFTAA
jgi:hypothetical protein